jgi:hypothetical protein
MPLLSPFIYLHHLAGGNGGQSQKQRRRENDREAGKQTSSPNGTGCLLQIGLGERARTQLEHRILSVKTLEFTHIISFPQSDKLKRLSTELAFR